MSTLSQQPYVRHTRRFATGEDTPRAFLDRCLALYAEWEPKVGAFVVADLDKARAAADVSTALWRAGKQRSALDGMPVGIKDIIETEDMPTEMGSPLFKGWRSGWDAASVAALRDAGAVIIGKTVTTEFAYFHPGKTRNPHDPTRTPGGSSSGSAAAVAAGMAPLAVGSQTNGSVIRPAAFCGVFGSKPGHGVISRAGALTLSRALDHVGIFARTLDDVALILDVLAGNDPADPDTLAFTAPAFRATLADAPPTPPSFALVRTAMWDKADPETRANIEQCANDLGAFDVELPADYVAGWDAQRAIMAADMAHNLGANLDKGEVSPQFRSLVEEGRKVTAVQYLSALRDARRYAAGVAEIFKRADAILTPSARGVAPNASSTGDPVFCTLWSLTGLPALNVPILAGENGLPIGLQLVGEPGRDERLLRIARGLLERLGLRNHFSKLAPARR